MIQGIFIFTSGINDGAVATRFAYGNGHPVHGFLGTDRIHTHKRPFVLIFWSANRQVSGGVAGKGVVMSWSALLAQKM